MHVCHTHIYIFATYINITLQGNIACSLYACMHVCMFLCMHTCNIACSWTCQMLYYKKVFTLYYSKHIFRYNSQCGLMLQLYLSYEPSIVKNTEHHLLMINTQSWPWGTCANNVFSKTSTQNSHEIAVILWSV